MSLLLLAAATALATVPDAASAPELPVKVVADTLALPQGLEADVALQVVADDIAAIFTAYEPAVPRVPGVKLSLTKEVVSTEAPVRVELPIQGGAFGKSIDERARVEVHTVSIPCPEAEGLGITLDFGASTYNIARRVDRIEIRACPRQEGDELLIDTVGEMYAGFLPHDPEKNRLAEGLGASALQGAFLNQVPAVFEAVETQWAMP